MKTGLGVDPGMGSVKMVRVRTGPGGVEVTSAARVEREDGRFPAGGVLRALRRARLPGRGALGLSGRDLILRYLATPPVPPWRLKKIVKFEIQEGMSGGAGVTTDYRPLALPTGLSENLVVAVAVARNSYLEDMLSQARSGGLKAARMSPSSVGLYRAFAASKLFKNGETTFLLDIGRENLEMAIQRDGELFFARSATGAGERFTSGIEKALGVDRARAESYKLAKAAVSLTSPVEADKRQLLLYGALREAAEALSGAVSGTVRFCRAQTKLAKFDFDKLFISGGGARLAGLRRFLARRLEVPVEVFDPARAFDLRFGDPEAEDLFKRNSLEFAVATGLAVLDAEPERFALSLLPPREVARREFWSRKVFTYLGAACFAGLALAASFRANSSLRRLKGTKERLDGEIAALSLRQEKIKKKVDDNDKLMSRIGPLLSEVQRNRVTAEFLALQRKACPEGLSLRSLTLRKAAPERTIGFDFEGVAAPGDKEFLEKLKRFQEALVESGRVAEIGGRRQIEIKQIDAKELTSKTQAEGLFFRCRVALKLEEPPK